MNKQVIKQLYKKEILDVLRDKKTVIMMLIVPLLVYPLMFMVGMQMMTRVATQLDTQTYKVVLDFEDKSRIITNMLTDESNEEWTFELCQVEDKEAALRREDIDAYVTLDTETDFPTYTVTYLSSVTNSSYAVDKLEAALKEYSLRLTVGQLQDAGLDAYSVLYPINIEYQDLSSKEEATGSMLGIIVPCMLVISLLMGTMYPAIDTTAGERERGTLETLLTLPITNQELVMSKFLTVATIGVASALLNMISMGGLGVYLYSITKDVMGTGEGVKLVSFVPALLIGILCVLAFAVLISALSMCFCVFAKTYKEANNYITPLMLVVMFASFVGLMPNVELTRNMALVPVANVCLLVRDLLLFKFNVQMITIVLFSNVAYGVLAVLLLGKIYNSEAVLFGDSVTTSQIFERRSNMKKGGAPSVGDASFALALALMLMIYLGGLLSAKNIHLGLVGTQLIVLLVPLLLAVYTKKNIRETFRLRGCRITQLFGGLLLMLGTILLGMILTAITSSIFKSNAVDLTQSMQEIMKIGFLPSLFLMAVMPAICEEMMFRGFLFSSFEATMRPWTAMILTSVLFGAYHMNMVQSITTTCVGLSICYLSYKSRSIVPGMAMHFLNNALSCVVSFYPEYVARVLPFLTKRFLMVSDILLILGVGIGLTALGAYIVRRTGKKV